LLSKQQALQGYRAAGLAACRAAGLQGYRAACRAAGGDLSPLGYIGCKYIICYFSTFIKPNKIVEQACLKNARTGCDQSKLLAR